MSLFQNAAANNGLPSKSRHSENPYHINEENKSNFDNAVLSSFQNSVRNTFHQRSTLDQRHLFFQSVKKDNIPNTVQFYAYSREVRKKKNIASRVSVRNWRRKGVGFLDEEIKGSKREKKNIYEIMKKKK